MKTFLLIGYFLLSLSTFAQTPEIQNLEAKLKTEQDATKKIDLLIKLSGEYHNISFEKSLRYGNKAVELAVKQGDSLDIADAYNNVGVAYDLYGNYSKATSYYYESLKIREAIGDSTGLSSCYNNLANIFDLKDDSTKAEEYYIKSLKIATALNDSSSIALAKGNLGSFYDYHGQHKKGLLYLEEALRLVELLKEYNGIAMNSNNLGFMYTERGKWEKAIPYHTRSLELATKNNNYLSMAYSFNGLAEAYKKGKQYNKALHYAKQNLDILKRLNSKDEIQIAAQLLSDIYSETGDYKKAHEYLTLHGQYKDSVHNATMDVKIAEMQLTYRNEKAEQENRLLKVERHLKNQQLERNTIIQICIFALLLMACVAAFVFFRSRQHLHGINQLLMHNSIILSQQKAELTDQAKLLHDQKEELEKLNTVKDRLFSVIAHDLKGPLVSLKGLLHIAATGSVPEDKFKMLLSKLETSQQNALWLLDNLLVWAKTQMRGIAFRPKEVQIYTLAQETVTLLQPQAHQKSITLINNIDESDYVDADPETTKIIFRNLISNAIKFSYTGGSISLTATRIANNLEISIADEGVGIKQDVIEKLFVARNYSSTGTADEKGSGLGLALCKEFAEQNGGTIRVESQPKHGSIFKFTLPLAVDAIDEAVELETVLESALY